MPSIESSTVTPISVDFSHYIANLLATRPVNPLIVKDIDGSTLSFLFQHDVPIGSRTIAYRKMKLLDNCHTCADRFGQTHAISDLDQSIWDCFSEVDPHYIHCTDYKKLAVFAASSCDSSITDLILLDQDFLFGHTVMVGGWHHITRLVTSDHQTVKNSTRTQLILDAIPRYVTSGLFNRFLTKLIPQGTVSLNLMKTCLNKAAYGHTFIPAVNWCTSVLADLATHTKKWDHFSPKEKISFALHHIIRAGLSKDFNGSVAMLFQTASGNIIGLLEDAKSESAMTMMCEERLSPQNYQRRTADASSGQIFNAIKYLGDFKNTIMTDIRAKELIPEIVCHGQEIADQSDNTSSMTGFAVQLEKTKVSKATSSFANRCGKSSIDVEITDIKTVRDFVKFTRVYPEIKVEVSVSSGEVAYVAETTLDNEKINHRHLWGFMNGRSNSEFGLTGQWTTVSHTIPMYEYISGHKCVLFVTPAIKSTSNFSNCCIPIFLTSQYNRICGAAFEGLNRTTKISVPTGLLMAGIGSSVVDTYNKLHSPINLRIGGIQVTLSTL